MSNVKFEFNLSGLRELMKSGEMQASLQEAGSAVASATGQSYGTDTHVAPYTAVCTVYPATQEAGLDNYLNNTLLKAMGASGLTWKTKSR